MTLRSGKVVKKKIVPKKKIHDEQGNTWEVVDQKKVVIVEGSDDEDSELSFE